MVWSKSVLLLYLIVTKSRVEGTRTVKRSGLSYGEPCSTPLDLRNKGHYYENATGDEEERSRGGGTEGDCDPEAFLGCKGGRCVCESEGDMLFNQTLGKCLVLANRPCNTNPNCVPYATCETTTIGSGRSQGLTEEKGGDVRNEEELPGWKSCNCNPGYRSHDIMGICLLWHNQPCSSLNDECHYGVHLKCLASTEQTDEICGCNPEGYLWSEDSNRCQGLEGTACYPLLGDECVESAECDVEKEECRCSPEYSATPTNSCLRRRGSECDNSTKMCNHYNNLVCNNSVCECPLGDLLMFYEQDTDKCYMRLGQSCSNNLGLPNQPRRNRMDGIINKPTNVSTVGDRILFNKLDSRRGLSNGRDEDKAVGSYGCHPSAECSPQNICECIKGKGSGDSEVAICDTKPSSSSLGLFQTTKDGLKFKIGISYLVVLLLTFLNTPQAWQINY